MELTIPRISGDSLTIRLDTGQQLYVVGANGTGKSALFQHWVTSVGNPPIKRIAAHRQMWLPSGNLDFTAQSRKQYEQNRMQWDREDNSRWMEHSPAQRQSAVLFDLVAKDNTRYRTIGQYIDNNSQEEATAFALQSESPFKQLNDLLRLGTLTVSLRNSNDEEILAQHMNNDPSFSIAQMSDGERAGAIMAANVLTVEPGTTLLIDEPERHLHRSIIEPFLSALFAKRQDCAFVISTHEIALPIANPAANAVILRSCEWNGNRPRAWDAEVLESGAELPEDLKRDILGARRRILFVEGTTNSRDLSLYGALFPELSVIPKGSCNEVIRAVNGLRSSQEHHHVEAFGLIDRDDRERDETEKLAEGGVFALDVCSVESLYYCSDAIASVAHRQAESLGCDPHAMLEVATQSALESIGADQDLHERMAARRSERLVHNRFTTHLPDWRNIKSAGEQLTISEPMENPYQGELNHFKGLVESGDLNGLNGLIARYGPEGLRESSVFERIVTTLGCRSQADYERMVVARVRDDANLTESLKRRIHPLAELLDGGRSNDA